MDDHDRVVLLNEIGANLIDVGLRDQDVALFAEAGKLGVTLGNPLERAQSFAMLGGERAGKGERGAAAWVTSLPPWRHRVHGSAMSLV